MATRTPNIGAHSHGDRDVSAFQQNIRYTNLANFMYKVQERYGPQERYADRKPAYTARALYNQLKSSRILTKEGEVRQERLEKWAKARGFKVKLTASPEQWGHITEGESP